MVAVSCAAVIENVVLIDEEDLALGSGEKLDVHRTGVLHRAFSVFAFNVRGELLLQRRALASTTRAGCGRTPPAGIRVPARRRPTQGGGAGSGRGACARAGSRGPACCATGGRSPTWGRTSSITCSSPR